MTIAGTSCNDTAAGDSLAAVFVLPLGDRCEKLDTDNRARILSVSGFLHGPASGEGKQHGRQEGRNLRTEFAPAFPSVRVVRLRVCFGEAGDALLLECSQAAVPSVPEGLRRTVRLNPAEGATRRHCHSIALPPTSRLLS